MAVNNRNTGINWFLSHIQKTEAKDSRSPLNLKIGLTVILLVTVIAGFIFYVQSEKEIDHANDVRVQSFLLADEMRQTSDDLTRAVQTYVVTGDTMYKKIYQNILDIREGKSPRPKHYLNMYWDVIAHNGKTPPDAYNPAISLLNLTMNAGINDEELRKFKEAKKNSDKLTIIEYEAMRLAETTGQHADSNKTKARLMVFDHKYYQTKISIMNPLLQLNELVDKRTLEAVEDATSKAMIFRILFIIFGLNLPCQ